MQQALLVASGVVLGVLVMVMVRKGSTIKAYAEGHRDGEAAGRLVERAQGGSR